jgi:SnoaL-like domain
MATTTVEAAVRNTAEELLTGMNSGDRERVRRCLSTEPGSVHIGTDPEEWWSSDEVVASLGNAVEGVQSTIEEMTVQPLGEDAAWFAGTGHFLGDGVDVKVRVSGVAVREDDRFVFVHSHASVGVPNDRLFE